MIHFATVCVHVGNKSGYVGIIDFKNIMHWNVVPDALPGSATIRLLAYTCIAENVLSIKLISGADAGLLRGGEEFTKIILAYTHISLICRRS